MAPKGPYKLCTVNTAPDRAKRVRLFWHSFREALRHGQELNYADGFSGVISEPLKILAPSSPPFSFSNTGFTNHLFVRPTTFCLHHFCVLSFTMDVISALSRDTVTCSPSYLIYLCHSLLIEPIIANSGPLSITSRQFEPQIKSAFGNTITVQLT
jgi:hypothetical protein